ncbi:MAG: hypothetical protein AAGD33_03090 [Actinomycetota bacterium]
MSRHPDAVVLTAPDGCTTYLQSAVEITLREIRPGSIVEVPCDPYSRIDLAEWCLTAGHRTVNPFEHLHIDHLLIEA